MSAERHLLFAVLAFENELIDLAQLTSTCRAWAEDKSKPLADLLVERGWLPLKNREFIDELVERKLAKHQQDARLALTVVTRGDVCDALKELDDSDINQSLSSWPSSGPVLVETIGYQPAGSEQSQSRYTWVSEVGKGGLGRVWLARDNELVREVALKEIKPGSESNEAIRRLIKEAQITGQLQHPNIVPIYEMNRGGRPFYTMKLVKGETLAQAIKRHHQQFAAQGVSDDASSPNHTLAPPASWNRYDQSRTAERAASRSLSMQRLMSVFLNVCDALAYAHSRGIIHRDLKPQNIVLGDYGEAIVLDWGLARRLDQKDDEAASVRITDDAHTEATQAGAVIGSPPYMAPEQAAGQIEAIDQRTDVYGLGAILFAILTGEAPHRKASGESVSDVLKRITQADAPRVRDRDPNLPEELDAVCAKAMAKSRDERFATAKDLKAALLEYQVHKESIDLTATAVADLEQARRTGTYPDYNRALFGFEEALRQWSANTRAAAGITETRGTYAESAFQHGDYDLALSLLSSLGELAIPDEHAALRSKIQLAAAERASRQQRIRRLRRFGIAASLTAATIATIAALWINAERQTANTERQNAVTAQKKAEAASVAEKKAKDEEVQQRRLAVAAAEAEKKAKEQEIVQRQAAEKAKDESITAQKKAEAAALAEKQAKELAVEAQKKAETAAIAEKKAKEGEMKQRMVAVDAAEAEKKQRLLAEQETKRANDESDHARLHLYAAHMNLAQAAWEGNDARETIRLLELYHPPMGQEMVQRDVRGFEWHYWDRLAHSALLTLKGRAAQFSTVAFSPDGRQLACTNADGTVKVWNALTAKEAFTLNGQRNFVYSVAFSPDQKQIASGHEDGTVKVWDVTTSKENLILKAHTGGVLSVAFSPDGKLLAAPANDQHVQMVKVWDATSGQELLALKGHTSGVTSVAFSPDGKRLASASDDQTVKVWDTTSGQAAFTLKGHIARVWSVAFSPDGERLASGSHDQTVKVWDATSGQELLTLKGHTHVVTSVAFSPDGKRLASASADQTVKVWDVMSGQEKLILKGHASMVGSVAFSPDGKRLASSTAGHILDPGYVVKVWDGTRGQQTETLSGHTGSVTSVAFSANGRRLVSASEDGAVKVWDATSGQEAVEVKAHAKGARVASSSDSKRIASVSDDGTVKVYEAATFQELFALKGRRVVEFSRDGKRLASLSVDTKSIMVWDVATGQESVTLQGDTNGVLSVAFSPDGNRLASANINQTVKVWDLVSSKEVLTLRGHSHMVSSVAFSPDGKLLASASYDQSVKVWDAATGQETVTLNGHTGLIGSVAFSPDGKRLASASHDQTVKVWDPINGQVMLTLNGHTGPVMSVAFSPDGKRLVSASSDKTIKVWDARPWTPELRAEREALSLIHFLRDQSQPQSAWLAAIAADQTISEPVRQRALQFAREWKPEQTSKEPPK